MKTYTFVFMDIHIGLKIKEIFDKSGFTVTELAKRVKTTRQNIYGIFERSSVDTALLLRLGEALDHNFFQYYMDSTSNNALEEPLEPYKKIKKKRRVVLQIEIEEDNQDEVLRLALGNNQNLLKNI